MLGWDEVFLQSGIQMCILASPNLRTLDLSGQSNISVATLEACIRGWPLLEEVRDHYEAKSSTFLLSRYV